MFRAYRYRLEYSGRRERLKKIYDSNLSLASISNPVTSQSFGASYCGQTESSRMCCLPVVCCIPLLFPWRFYYFLTRTGQFPLTTGRLTCLWHRCLARCELCHILRVLRGHLSSRKKYKILASQSSFSTPEPSLLWQSRERKDSQGDKITSRGQDYLKFRHAGLFLGGPGLPPEVVSAHLNFSARGPKNLLLHDKNQACRALYYWPTCQNLGVPYPK